MAVVPAVSDYHRIMAGLLVSLTSGRLSWDECMREGADLWAFCRAAAALAQIVAFEASQAERALYLDTAKGDRLDKLTLDRWGIQHDPATPSRGTVAIKHLSGPADDLTIAAESVIQSADGILVHTIAAVTIPAGATAWITVTAQSVDAGAGRNIAAGDITQFESPPADDLVVSNEVADGGTAFAGSNDAETDESLRARARSIWWTQQRGTLEALRSGALEVDEVRHATAAEVLQNDGTYGGVAYLYIADSQGESSGAMEISVENVLNEWRPAGVFVDVLGGSPEYVAILLDLTLIAGYDMTVVRAKVIAALAMLGYRMSAGETLLYGDLLAAIRAVPGVLPYASTVVSPAGDVEPTATNKVLRIRAGDVTFQ